jgi:segregation and condensation protein B
MTKKNKSHPEADALPLGRDENVGAENFAEEQLEAALPDDQEFLKGLTESLLFASREPLTEQHYLAVVGQRRKGKLAEFVRQLNVDYERTGRAFEILHVAGGYQFFTRPDFSGALKKLAVERNKSRVSRAALETLAVVAFRGPVTRGEIDDIRGVDSGGVLRTLLERRMVAVKGRSEVVGKPLLYETTPEFLKHFGLSALTDLPRDSELTREWGKLQELESAERDSQTDLITTEMVNETADNDLEAHAEVRTNGHHHGHPMVDLIDSPDKGETQP